jgi:hypothetical protein
MAAQSSGADSKIIDLIKDAAASAPQYSAFETGYPEDFFTARNFVITRAFEYAGKTPEESIYAYNLRLYESDAVIIDLWYGRYNFDLIFLIKEIDGVCPRADSFNFTWHFVSPQKVGYSHAETCALRKNSMLIITGWCGAANRIKTQWTCGFTIQILWALNMRWMRRVCLL